MSDNVKLWCFILLLPFLAAIGYDFYANYLADPDKQAQLESLNIDPDKYMASDVGYLFVTHAPEFYDNTKASLDNATWAAYIDPLLQQYTWAVALVPAALFFAWLLIARIFGLPPFGEGLRFGGKPKLKNDPFLKHEKQDGFKYKRR